MSILRGRADYGHEGFCLYAAAQTRLLRLFWVMAKAGTAWLVMALETYGCTTQL